MTTYATGHQHGLSGCPPVDVSDDYLRGYASGQRLQQAAVPLLAAAIDVLDDLGTYARRAGDGPQRRLTALRDAIQAALASNTVRREAREETPC